MRQLHEDNPSHLLERSAQETLRVLLGSSASSYAKEERASSHAEPFQHELVAWSDHGSTRVDVNRNLRENAETSRRWFCGCLAAVVRCTATTSRGEEGGAVYGDLALNADRTQIGV